MRQNPNQSRFESPVKLDFGICWLLLQGTRHFEFLSPEFAQRNAIWNHNGKPPWEKIEFPIFNQVARLVGSKTINDHDSESECQGRLDWRWSTTTILNQNAKVGWCHDDQSPNVS